ncbi:MAG: 60S ribosomal protein L26 [Candidatus Thalassarchaeaceae archaeon]|jgi:large subunit ribosomal protein L24|nr:60S ribosomal protein L26 [Candidatus Thalassarchaeaceae archaeon]MDP6317931.1 60S ribosomal protein L26 [Candidatus Thalassarchaeaceae archaeon]HJM29664.1 60S ribosomal protein L26 [Candidatus Thalassarchaeaceae archaeon]HJN69872.1 60S ribosomal protein L26 [Candidatus Thalassarchaeaceae archaeon]|tara:strand:+ start:761 stop:1198 length:438 start_codon:yes stop_codon:yes gene_type:complete
MVSKKAGKQRQAQTDAPVHVRRKRMRARLITDDPDLQAVRSVTVRVGDTVEVLRGDFGFPNSVKTDSRGKRLGQSRGRAGVKSTIASVDTKNGLVYVDGVTKTTADGKEEAVPLHPSNLIVTKLNDADPLRRKRIVERSNGGAEQ